MNLMAILAMHKKQDGSNGVALNDEGSALNASLEAAIEKRIEYLGKRRDLVNKDMINSANPH